MKKGYILAGCLLAVMLVGCSGSGGDAADKQIAADTHTPAPGSSGPPGLRRGAGAAGGAPTARKTPPAAADQ
jgi:hypothetical protein